MKNYNFKKSLIKLKKYLVNFFVILFFTFLTWLFYGIITTRDKLFLSENLILRQIEKKVENTETTKISYFLLFGDYSSSKTETPYLKILVDIDGLYKFVSIPLEKINFKINNKLEKPNLTLKYIAKYRLTNKTLFENSKYNITYIVNTPEEFLPEKLNELY